LLAFWKLRDQNDWMFSSLNHWDQRKDNNNYSAIEERSKS
jgi:hypothetical protein